MIDYRDLIAKDFVSKFEKELKKRYSCKVLDADNSKELRDAFKQGEEAGRESQNRIAVEVINELLFAVEKEGEQDG